MGRHKFLRLLYVLMVVQKGLS